MLIQTADITEKGFSPTNTAQTLRLVVGQRTLNAVVSLGNQLLALKGWHFNPTNPMGSMDKAEILRDLNTVLATEPLFDGIFAETIVFLANPYCTLVPEKLFNPDVAPDTYLKLLTLPHEPLTVGSSHLTGFPSKMVFATEKETYQLLRTKFPTTRFSHIARILLENWNKSVKTKEPQVFLHTANGVGHIAVFSRQELLFFNSFNFQTSTDLVYFVLLPYEHLKLNPEDVSITLSGDIEEFSPNYKIIYRYINKVFFMPLPKGLTLPGALLALPEHLFYDLYAPVTL